MLILPRQVVTNLNPVIITSVRLLTVQILNERLKHTLSSKLLSLVDRSVLSMRLSNAEPERVHISSNSTPHHKKSFGYPHGQPNPKNPITKNYNLWLKTKSLHSITTNNVLYLPAMPAAHIPRSTIQYTSSQYRLARLVVTRTSNRYASVLFHNFIFYDAKIQHLFHIYNTLAIFFVNKPLTLTFFNTHYTKTSPTCITISVIILSVRLQTRHRWPSKSYYNFEQTYQSHQPRLLDRSILSVRLHSSNNSPNQGMTTSSMTGS